MTQLEIFPAREKIGRLMSANAITTALYEETIYGLDGALTWAVDESRLRSIQGGHRAFLGELFIASTI